MSETTETKVAVCKVCAAPWPCQMAGLYPPRKAQRKASEAVEPRRPRVMTEREQEEHRQTCITVRSVVSALRLSRLPDEDVRVAVARLENWLAENDERWTA